MNFIRKHEIPLFYICTYLLTGLLFFLQIFAFPSFAFPLYLLAPAIISSMMIAVLDKSVGIKYFYKKNFATGFHFKWVIICVLLPIVIIFAAKIADNIVQGQSFNYWNSASSITPGFILMIAIGCIGEEVGWRGYLLPLLLKRHNSLLSSIILGTLWGFWHAGDYGEGIGFLLFVVSTIALSIIMTWLYHKSNGSVLVAILFHFIYNLAGSYAAFTSENGITSVAVRVIMAITCMIPAILLVFISPVFRTKGDNGKIERNR